ncbi:MAG: hypothetical protein VB031_02080 [Eubacteriaceae bacterium]|nr:hypothetical protein [Eubacteriaceae bacterium]
MKMEVGLLIAVIGLIITLILGLRSNRTSSDELRNQENESLKRSAYNEGKIDAKLDSISATVTRTDTNVENLKSDITDVKTRLTKVEESNKQAHDRLNRIAGNKE